MLLLLLLLLLLLMSVRLSCLAVFLFFFLNKKKKKAARFRVPPRAPANPAFLPVLPQSLFFFFFLRRRQTHKERRVAASPQPSRAVQAPHAPLSPLPDFFQEKKKERPPGSPHEKEPEPGICAFASGRLFFLVPFLFTLPFLGVLCCLHDMSVLRVSALAVRWATRAQGRQTASRGALCW